MLFPTLYILHDTNRKFPRARFKVEICSLRSSRRSVLFVSGLKPNLACVVRAPHQRPGFYVYVT